MVKINATSHINRPIIIPPISSENVNNVRNILPSSSPLRYSQPKLLATEKATRLEYNFDEKISVNVNSSFFSSPSKKIILPKGKTTQLNPPETDGYSCEFSQIESFKNNQGIPSKQEKLLTAIKENDNISKDLSYTIDESVSTFLKRFNNDGVLELGLEEVSYSVPTNSSTPRKKNKSNNFGIELQINYSKFNIEAIIGIPPIKDANNLKEQILSELKFKLIASQNGPRKYKVVILTPRTGASWLERKLEASSSLHFHYNYQYIVIKTKKSFAQSIRDCLQDYL